MFEKLQELPLLIGLSVSELMEILENVKFEFNKYDEGTTIASQGDRCEKVIYILKGEICVDRRGGDMIFTENVDKTPFLLEPENLWGMKQKYTHTYSFNTEGNTCSIDKKQLNYLISNYGVMKTNLLAWCATNCKQPTKPCNYRFQTIWKPESFAISAIIC